MKKHRENTKQKLVAAYSYNFFDAIIEFLVETRPVTSRNLVDFSATVFEVPSD